MKRIYVWMVFLLTVASLLLSACGQNLDETTMEKIMPAIVEHLDGEEPTRLTLTADAAKRLDIQTATVLDAQVNGTQRKVIPYSAILYDIEGGTWVYISPVQLTFVRTSVTVDYIEGDQAVLSAGPPSGSAVVIVGAAELYGSESEFEEE